MRIMFWENTFRIMFVIPIEILIQMFEKFLCFDSAQLKTWNSNEIPSLSRFHLSTCIL